MKDKVGHMLPRKQKIAAPGFTDLFLNPKIYSGFKTEEIYSSCNSYL